MNKKTKDKLDGQIGWASGETLGLPLGHYVVITKDNGQKVDVRTFTSLVDANKGNLKPNKIKAMLNGEIYPLPKSDYSLRRYSGLHKCEIKGIRKDKIKFDNDFKFKKKHLALSKRWFGK